MNRPDDASLSRLGRWRRSWITLTVAAVLASGCRSTDGLLPSASPTVDATDHTPTDTTLGDLGHESSSNDAAATEPLDSSEGRSETGPDVVVPAPAVFGDQRPAALRVPSTYEPSVPTPLLLILHGYFTDPNYVSPMLRLETLHETAGVLTIAPSGLVNPEGYHFWNAAPACCDYYQSGVDDVTYLAALVEEVMASYNVDPRRIYAIGHSNGSFMANRLACVRDDLFAAIISVAGAANLACAPSEPVSVLHVHGTDDDIILYEGGFIGNAPYPSAEQTVTYWATANDCQPDLTPAGRIDLNAGVPGDDTDITRFLGCPDGIDVELWTENAGPHNPWLPDHFPTPWWEWLEAHPKPIP